MIWKTYATIVEFAQPLLRLLFIALISLPLDRSPRKHVELVVSKAQAHTHSSSGKFQLSSQGPLWKLGARTMLEYEGEKQDSIGFYISV